MQKPNRLGPLLPGGFLVVVTELRGILPVQSRFVGMVWRPPLFGGQTSGMISKFLQCGWEQKRFCNAGDLRFKPLLARLAPECSKSRGGEDSSKNFHFLPLEFSDLRGVVGRCPREPAGID